MHAIVRRYGFTIVELAVVISVIGILAGISIVSYSGYRDSVDKTSIKSDLLQAASSMNSYNNFKNTYTRNIAGTGFVPSAGVAIRPLTNISVTYVVEPYNNLTPAQNTELFLYSCNEKMAALSRSCDLIGNNTKVHIPGTQGSSTQWIGNICETSDSGCGTVLPAGCDGVPNSECQSIVAIFKQQGGTLPINLGEGRQNLPAQNQNQVVSENNRITRYCLEGRSVRDGQIVYHIFSSSRSVAVGECNDASLRYLP